MFKRSVRPRKMERPAVWIKLNPAQALSVGFLIRIAVGTLLLMLPFATKDRGIIYLLLMHCLKQPLPSV
ncbi:hypothetical protein GCM10009865_07330 [Aeromicrobium ponti]